MSDIGPGDFIEFIGFPPEPLLDGPLVRGRLYRALSVDDRGCTCGKPGGVSLADGPNPRPPFEGWCIFGFRPVYRPRAELVDELVDELVAPADPARLPARETV